MEALAASLRLKATASYRLQEVPPARSAAFLARLADPEDRAAFLAPLGRIVSVSAVDGVRVGLEGSAVIHFRASGNAPELRWGLSAAGAAVRV